MKSILRKVMSAGAIGLFVLLGISVSSMGQALQSKATSSSFVKKQTRMYRNACRILEARRQKEYMRSLYASNRRPRKPIAKAEIGPTSREITLAYREKRRNRASENFKQGQSIVSSD